MSEPSTPATDPPISSATAASSPPAAPSGSSIPAAGKPRATSEPQAAPPAEARGGGGAAAAAREIPWRPLLSGAAAEEALAIAEEIAAAICAEDAAAPAGAAAGQRRFSLAGGDAGSAIFLAYLDAARPGRGYGDAALAHLERAIDGMEELVSPPGLYSGFPGVGWAVEHLNGRLFEDEEDPGREVADVLADHLGQSPWRQHYELILGIAGLGLYGIERLPRPRGEDCVRQTVARLAELAQRQGETVTWWTSRDWLAPDDRERYGEGNYNLGVSHGVPGVIGFLGEALAVLGGAGAAEARGLLSGAVAWLLAQRLPPGMASQFPDSIRGMGGTGGTGGMGGMGAAGAGIEPSPTRISWCYGDLGISCALLVAARHAGESAWESEALALARATAARGFEKSGVIDPGLCHGTSGAAHLFNRLYQASGEPVFAEAARGWLERTLAMRKPGTGCGGFSAWVPDANGELSWQPEPGLLAGGAGVGLALLAAASPVEPAWDRLLLVRIPPRRG